METDGQGVDGEVATELVVFQAAVFHDGFAGVLAVGFPSGAHEFYLEIFVFQLGRPKILKDMYLDLFAQAGGNGFGQLDTTAHRHHIDIFGGTTQEQIAHIATNDVAGKVFVASHLGDDRENRVV